MNKNVLAYIALILKCIIYGLSILFTSKLLENEAIFDVLAFRFLVSAVFLEILRVFKVIKVDFKGKNIKAIFLVTIFEPIGYFIFEIIGIEHTSTLMTGIILSLMPVAVVISETLILKESTSLVQKLFLVMSVLGTAFVAFMSSTNNDGSTIWGILFIILALTSGSLYLIFTRKFSAQFKPAEITYFMVMVGAVTFNLINIVIHVSDGSISNYFEPLFNIQNTVGLLYLGVLASVCATMMNNFALGRIQASSASVFGGINTIVTVLAGVLFNNEAFFWYHAVGGVLILIGAVGTNYYRIRTFERTHELNGIEYN